MKLKIHVWGGFGSQLHSVALYHKIKDTKLRNRQIQFVFHTGGVTFRGPEILDLLPPGTSFAILNDFSSFPGKPGKPVQRNYISLLLLNVFTFVKKLVLKSKFVVTCNNDLSEIRWWTISIRGHYKYQRLSHRILRVILDSLVALREGDINPSDRNSAAIHYRLGDLIGLKPIIDQTVLVDIVKKYVGMNCTRINAFSDSVQLLETFPRKINGVPVLVEDTAIRDMFSRCLDAKFFFGTDSKISFWLTFLRLANDSNSFNVVPATFLTDFELTLGSPSRFKNLIFYQV